MFKFTLVALLLIASFATAQSEGFHRNTTSGAYIYRMLDYAVYERVPCIPQIAQSLPPTAQDYLCIVDTDSVAFEDDVDDYLSIYPEPIASDSGWLNHAGSNFKSIGFTDGYMLAIAVKNTTVVLLGGF